MAFSAIFFAKRKAAQAKDRQLQVQAAKKGFKYRLRVSVNRGVGLINVEEVSKSDPFCVLKVGEEQRRTKMIANDLNPIWNEKYDIMLKEKQDQITFAVFDMEGIGEPVAMGGFVLHIDSLLDVGDRWFSRKLRIDSQPELDCGELEFEMDYTTLPQLEELAARTKNYPRRTGRPVCCRWEEEQCCPCYDEHGKCAFDHPPAAHKGSYSCCLGLLENSTSAPDVDTPDLLKQSPLHMACLAGHEYQIKVTSLVNSKTSGFSPEFTIQDRPQSEIDNVELNRLKESISQMLLKFTRDSVSETYAEAEEDTVNKLERETGIDLDGDGDIGETGQSLLKSKVVNDGGLLLVCLARPSLGVGRTTINKILNDTTLYLMKFREAKQRLLKGDSSGDPSSSWFSGNGQDPEAPHEAAGEHERAPGSESEQWFSGRKAPEEAGQEAEAAAAPSDEASANQEAEGDIAPSDEANVATDADAAAASPDETSAAWFQNQEPAQELA